MKLVNLLSKTMIIMSIMMVLIATNKYYFDSYPNQGTLLFSKFEFFIKPDLRDLSFLTGGLMQFFIK